MSTTSILALFKYGREAASTRQRLLQFAPYLAEHGFSIEFTSLVGDAHVRALAHGRRSSPLVIAKGYAHRFRTLATAHRHDLIWLNYEAFPYLPAWLERLPALTGRPIVLDLDDAIFHQYDDHPKRLVRAILGGKLRAPLAGAQVVTAGNAYLAAYAQNYARDVRIIPTVVDTERYVPAVISHSRRPLVIGWIGSPSTWGYVEPLLPDLLPAIARAGGVLRAVGAGPAARRWTAVECTDWSEAGEIAAVQNMDIGIMPLPDERWARGKCGYKLIQYMACGLPTIASPVGVNNAIVADGVSGILATTTEEWTAAIARLCADATLRETMGAVGRRIAVERYSLGAQAPHVLAALTDALQAHH